jgi:hypothetical protein
MKNIFFLPALHYSSYAYISLSLEDNEASIGSTDRLCDLVLPDFLRSSGSGTELTQPREYN